MECPVWIRLSNRRQVVLFRASPNWVAEDIINEAKNRFELPLGTYEYCLKIKNVIIERDLAVKDIAAQTSKNDPVVIDRTNGSSVFLTFRV